MLDPSFHHQQKNFKQRLAEFWVQILEIATSQMQVETTATYRNTAIWSNFTPT
jgi:hypothetical protein